MLNRSSKFIDSQKIFPKRLGTYQNGNALILQYYNLQTDKFKKHVIPLDNSKSVKENLQNIYKNQKHNILLRKVNKKYVQSAIKGQNCNYGQNLGNNNWNMNNNYNNNNGNFNNFRQGNNQYNNQHNQYNQYNQYNNNNSYSNILPSNIDSNQLNNQNSSQNQTSLTSKNQNQISQINIKSSIIDQNIKQQINEIQQYYQEQFQDFQVSQSLGKKNNIIKEKQNQKKQQQQKNIQEGKTKSKQKKQKSKKKSKKKQQVQEQFQFDFLDDQAASKKKPKQSKQKRQKSKQKKQSSKKKQDKPSSKKQQKKAPVVSTNIQQQFQFL